MTDSERERIIDRIVQSRLANSSAYRNAENADEQARVEELIEGIVEAELDNDQVRRAELVAELNGDAGDRCYVCGGRRETHLGDDHPFRTEAEHDHSTGGVRPVSGPANVSPEDRRRRKVAELRLLETFDVIREPMGHDYGKGQRAKELIRRRRELGLAGGIASTPSSTPAELVAAYERIGRPRLERAQAGAELFGTTPTARKTIEAWRRVRRATATAAERELRLYAASAVPPATMRPATFKIGGAPAVAPLSSGRPSFGPVSKPDLDDYAGFAR